MFLNPLTAIDTAYFKTFITTIPNIESKSFLSAIGKSIYPVNVTIIISAPTIKTQINISVRIFFLIDDSYIRASKKITIKFSTRLDIGIFTTR